MRSAQNNSSRQLAVYGHSFSIANCRAKKLGDYLSEYLEFWELGYIIIIIIIIYLCMYLSNISRGTQFRKQHEKNRLKRLRCKLVSIADS